MTGAHLDEPPRAGRDVLHLRWWEALAYDGIGALASASGRWRRPVRASGDLEDMTFLDKVYWAHKSTHPVALPARGSGLDAVFAAQEAPRSTPAGFTATRAVSLSAVGDLMDHAYLAGSARTLWPEVADLVFDVDLAMGNFEGVARADSMPLAMGNLGEGAPLAIGAESLDVLAGGAAGTFGFLSTASNHSLDFGAAGVDATIDALRTRGIASHGTNRSEDEVDRATIVERNGVRLGLIAHTFGLNAYRPPADRPRIVNHTKLNRGISRADLSTLVRQLAHCRSEAVDFVVAQLHWGMEFELYPRPEQRTLAHHLAEMGVDAIVGHHPHVLQPAEYHRTRRDPDRVVPIFYSLGNLTNPFSIPFMCRSGVARMELAKGTARDGASRTYVRRARVAEVVQDADPSTRTLRLRRAT